MLAQTVPDGSTGTGALQPPRSWCEHPDLWSLSHAQPCPQLQRALKNRPAKAGSPCGAPVVPQPPVPAATAPSSPRNREQVETACLPMPCVLTTNTKRYWVTRRSRNVYTKQQKIKEKCNRRNYNSYTTSYTYPILNYNLQTTTLIETPNLLQNSTLLQTTSLLKQATLPETSSSSISISPGSKQHKVISVTLLTVTVSATAWEMLGRA